jgi:hypothetical protein
VHLDLPSTGSSHEQRHQGRQRSCSAPFEVIHCIAGIVWSYDAGDNVTVKIGDEMSVRSGSHCGRATLYLRRDETKALLLVFVVVSR